jgi:hypothetical protein
VVGAEHARADGAHVAGLGQGLLPAAEPPEIDAEAVPRAQRLGVGGPLDAGAVVDQLAVQGQRLLAAAEAAQADADLVAGGQGVRVVRAQGPGAGLGDLAVVSSASGQRPSWPRA